MSRDRFQLDVRGPFADRSSRSLALLLWSAILGLALLLAPASTFAQCTATAVDVSSPAPMEPMLEWIAGGTEPPEWAVFLKRLSDPDPTLPTQVLPAGSRSWLVTPPLPMGETFEWWVSGWDFGTPVCTSLHSQFTTQACPEGPPALDSPPDGSTLRDSIVEFHWNAVASAVEYEHFLRSSGQSSWSSMGRTANDRLTVQLIDGTYDWYVQAFGPSGCDPQPGPGLEVPFSVIVFTGPECPPGAPTLVSPSPNAPVTSPITFAWTATPPAFAYQVEAFNSGGLVYEYITAATEASASLPSGSYEWRVSALADNCPPATTALSPFIVESGGNCEANQPATLVSPPDRAEALPALVNFEWIGSPGAFAYELYVQSGEMPMDRLAVTDGTSVLAELPPGRVRWRVDALFEGCPPLASQQFEFTVAGASSCPSSSPALLEPAGGASVTSPATFRWSEVAGASGYQLWMSANGDPFVNLGGLTTATTMNENVPAGSIDWYVEAWAAECPPLVSEIASFSVQRSVDCGQSRATLLAPANGANDVPSPVTFSWNSVPGAFAYRVLASIDGNPPGEIGFAESTSIVQELPQGTIVWSVESFVPGCDPVESEQFFFSVALGSSCSAAAATPISPGPGSVVSSSTEFTWASPVPDAIHRIWLRQRGEAPFVLFEGPESSAPAFLPPGEYEWHVESFVDGCPPAASSVISFGVNEGTNCSLEPPSPVSPADGADGIAAPVDFQWAGVTGASAYAVWVQGEDGFEFPVDFTSETSSNIYLPQGRWSWFVEGFVDGCEPLRSAAAAFSITVNEQCYRQVPFPLHPPIGDGVTLSSPVYFEWTAVPDAIRYDLLASIDGSEPALLDSPQETSASIELPDGLVEWFVVAFTPSCPPNPSPAGRFRIARDSSGCDQPDTPEAAAVPQARSGDGYEVFWQGVPRASTYEIQESANEDFTDAESQTRQGFSSKYKHEVLETTAFYYRVRALSECGAGSGLFSAPVRVVVYAPENAQTIVVDQIDIVGSSEEIVQQVFVAGGSVSQQFTAVSTKSWMKVNPASGSLPPDGVTLTVTTDPTSLPPGASTGTIVVTISGAKSAENAEAGAASSVPVSVSLVAPTSPTKKSPPTSSSLIIPAVGRAPGSNSQWQSDIRISNVSSQTLNYLLYFTKSGTAGTGTVQQASVAIAPGQTIAFNDILKSWYGIGAAGEAATGTLEIRPQASSLGAGIPLAGAQTTVASSRTYNVSTAGTFGQFIPAVPFSNFVGKGRILSLQQIAQSNEYRTNIGVVEGSGEAATVQFEAFSGEGQTLATWSESMQAGEHRQFDRILASKGITIDDGRIEVSVTSDKGKITAYASKVDNVTSDPELIVPVEVATVSESKYVVPGVGDVDNGLASWRTDLRLYNGGTTDQTATMTFYPQGNPTASSSKQVTVKAGEVLEMNDLLKTQFGTGNTLGALHIATSGNAKLVPTARTYNQTTSGTYGQFIPAVTVAQGIKLGSRSLQLLQVEQSSKFRTNMGIFELSGAPATVEVSAIMPESLAAPRKTYSLQANEFRQIGFILNDLGITEGYNARIVVKVTAGAGVVSAYASVVDMATQDPTYVPAQ